jgi:nucleoside-triphosphatase
MKKNILLTGGPGAGRTTLIRRLSEIFKEFNPAGFYTTEIVEDGAKTGFLVASLFGDSKVLSHISLKSKYAVGKYRIDIKGFENLLQAVFSNEKKTGLYLVDEIDRIECESKKFKKVILEILSADKPVVATIAEKGTGLISELKKREDVNLIEITPGNRDLHLKELTMEIMDLLLG